MIAMVVMMMMIREKLVAQFNGDKNNYNVDDVKKPFRLSDDPIGNFNGEINEGTNEYDINDSNCPQLLFVI